LLILAVALIVVGPEKLPELARSLARQVVELKKAANTLRDSLSEAAEEEPWERVSPETPRLAEKEAPGDAGLFEEAAPAVDETATGQAARDDGPEDGDGQRRA